MTWTDGQYNPKQKRADEKKNRLLDAALELFASEGYHGTTAKAIAAKAGVATGSFYRYFRDKKVVFMAVCMAMEERLGGRIFELGHEMRRQGRAEQEILNELIRLGVTAHERNKDFHREVLVMQIRDPDVAAWCRQREGRLVAALLEFLRPIRSSLRVQDLEAAAELIYYAIEEAAHRAVIFDSPIGQERLIHQLQDMVTRYLFA